jgi:phosphoribosylformylglycinamidine synthase
VPDTRTQITPLLDFREESELLLIDLGFGKNRMGGSCLAQVYNQIGNSTPDMDSPSLFAKFFSTINQLNNEGLIEAYHDRSDGGLIVTLLEMAFTSHCGLNIHTSDPIPELFNEELGCVIQVFNRNKTKVLNALADAKISSQTIATTNKTDEIFVYQDDELIFCEKRSILHHSWSSTSFEIAKLRDNPKCAQSENDQLLVDSKGLIAKPSFDIDEHLSAPYINVGNKPKIAILREQGINGHIEMAAAFSLAGFEASDVHMSDILAGKISLADYKGLAACGGFSYGDVLGAGRGWANSILYNEKTKDEFSAFFDRSESFTLGVCNGCQMISNLKEIIPGTNNWPTFERNTSEQFEARVTSVEIMQSESLFFEGMAGSIMPIAVAHGEGRANFSSASNTNNITIRYVDHNGNATQTYPHNPNGSENAVASLCDDSGRIAIMMPHPERVFRSIQNSWHPNSWKERSPWMRMFENARKWVD